MICFHSDVDLIRNCSMEGHNALSLSVRYVVFSFFCYLIPLLVNQTNNNNTFGRACKPQQYVNTEIAVLFFLLKPAVRYTICNMLFWKSTILSEACPKMQNQLTAIINKIF